MTTAQKTIVIASAEMCDSPGLWRYFLARKKTETKKWSVDFLRAFSNDRLTLAECRAALAGKYSTAEKPSGKAGVPAYLVLTVMR